ncbi:hypothetical protein AB1N83_011266 [Pleurotus pulmonarius]
MSGRSKNSNFSTMPPSSALTTKPNTRVACDLCSLRVILITLEARSTQSVMLITQELTNSNNDCALWSTPHYGPEAVGATAVSCSPLTHFDAFIVDYEEWVSYFHACRARIRLPASLRTYT